MGSAVNTSERERSESNSAAEETMALFQEKCRLRRQYSLIKDPAVKMSINQLQKQIKNDIRIETQASWEKFCNSICLETGQSDPFHKIKNFPDQRVSVIIRLCIMMTKSPKQMQTRCKSLLNLLKDTSTES